MKTIFKNEGNLWGVPYGDCELQDDDGKYIDTLFNYEVAMGDMFIKDIRIEVAIPDQIYLMADAVSELEKRFKTNEGSKVNLCT